MEVAGSRRKAQEAEGSRREPKGVVGVHRILPTLLPTHPTHLRAWISAFCLTSSMSSSSATHSGFFWMNSSLRRSCGWRLGSQRRGVVLSIKWGTVLVGDCGSFLLGVFTADNCRDQKGGISDSSRNREISPRAQISPGRDLPFEGGIWMAPKYRARQISPFWSLQLSAVRASEHEQETRGATGSDRKPLEYTPQALTCPVLISLSLISRRHCGGSSYLSKSDGRRPSHLMSGQVRLNES